MGMMARGFDSLINFMTMMGSTKDPSSAFNLKATLNLLDRATLNMIFRGDWIGKRVVKAPAMDATRAWRNWQAEQDQIEKIEEVEKTFNVQLKLKAAMTAARLYGAAGLVVGVDDGSSPDKELDIERVGKDSFTFLHVMNRYELRAEAPITDIESMWFGHPEFYTVQPRANQNSTAFQTEMKIHPSRVIRLIGEELPDTENLGGSGDGWRGDSVLQAVDDVIRATSLVNQGIAGLIHDMKLDIFKIPGFSQMIGDDTYKAKLQNRLQLANTSKSLFNSLAMDAEEELSRNQTNFAGLPDLMMRYLALAAGASEIPQSRLLGQVPQGLGGTSGGDTDIRNYYDRISSEQKTILSPALTVLDEIIIRSALGDRDEAIYYDWAPLWQLTSQEKADIALKKAQTTKIYIDGGIINEDAMRIAVKNQLIEDATYPGLDQAIEEEGLDPPEPEGGFDPHTGAPLDPTTGLPVSPAVTKALAAAHGEDDPEKMPPAFGGKTKRKKKEPPSS